MRSNKTQCVQCAVRESLRCSKQRLPRDQCVQTKPNASNALSGKVCAAPNKTQCVQCAAKLRVSIEGKFALLELMQLQTALAQRPELFAKVGVLFAEFAQAPTIKEGELDLVIGPLARVERL